MTLRETLLALVCLSLLAPLSSRAEEPAVAFKVAFQDDWLGQDKALHFGVSAGLAGAGYAGGALLFDEPGARWLTGAGVALTAGVGKELYDAGWGTGFSFKDLTWDVVGTATGLGLSWAVDRLFFQRAAPARTTEGTSEVSGSPASRASRTGLPGGLTLSMAVSVGGAGLSQGGPGNDRNSPVMLLLMGGW
jgi:putative lipoprotein